MDRTLINFIDDLISDYGNSEHGYRTVSVSDLPQKAKEKFAALLMRKNHDENKVYGACFEWIEQDHETLFSDYLSSSNPEAFLDAMKKQAVKYFKEEMDEKLHARVIDLLADQTMQYNRRLIQDRQSGEVTWSRY